MGNPPNLPKLPVSQREKAAKKATPAKLDSSDIKSQSHFFSLLIIHSVISSAIGKSAPYDAIHVQSNGKRPTQA